MQIPLWDAVPSPGWQQERGQAESEQLLVMMSGSEMHRGKTSPFLQAHIPPLIRKPRKSH